MPRLGVLTKTVIRSPVIKFVLHARIRHQRHNDVVFIGDHFIHVKQVKHGGHLEHIATKSDFDARIRAARTLSTHSDAQDEDLLVKTETANGSDAGRPVPPQFLVLTLDSDDLMFVYLGEYAEGSPCFFHKTCPMPTYDRALEQTGAHLAVDPYSRALAVGANERQVIIYSAKSKECMHNEIRNCERDWCPVKNQQKITIAGGVILHMEFLIPPDSDQDHIVLLLITVDRRKTRAVLIDWFFSSPLSHAQIHTNQPIDSAQTIPNLLVPLKEAAFLLVNGNEMRLYREILSGSLRCIKVGSFVPDELRPGSSPRTALWASWCRPRRTRAVSREKDILYFIREDGLVHLAQITPGESGFQWSDAGDAACHVGAACASLGDDIDPDILAMVGEMSNGKVVSIGAWAIPGRVSELSRYDTMAMQLIEVLPNWASATDMLVSRLPHSQGRSARSRDAVFITSGRQPYGTITELRKGLEARLSTYFGLDNLRSVNDAWVLPNRSTGSVLIFLSTPSSTRLLDFDPDGDGIVELIDSDVNTFDLTRHTLAAEFMDGYLLQVTEQSICAGISPFAGFEDRSRWEREEGSLITAAAIEPRAATILVIKRIGTAFSLQTFIHAVDNGETTPEDREEGLQQVGTDLPLCNEPTCIATTAVGDELLGIIATVSGTLEMCVRKPTQATRILASFRIPGGQQSLCDSIVILHAQNSLLNSWTDLLAVCGLRDGRILSVMIKNDGELFFGNMHVAPFGQTTVQLDRHSSDLDRAYAISGRDLCMLSWDGGSADSLAIRSVWVSDKARPELSQDIIMATSKMPSSEYFASQDMVDSLVVISSEEFWVASVGESTTTVPRQVSVQGSPNRLVYCGQLRSLVCASVCCGVRSFPSEMPHAKPEERRQIWPAIDFIPSHMDQSSFTFEYQPGDRIYALAEWVLHTRGKAYAFLIVAGSYIKPNGTVKGRITMLQPTISKWEVVDVQERNTNKFDEPVTALALYDEITYVACTGVYVVAWRFSPDEQKWKPLCHPCKVSGNGIAISVSDCLIHVSMVADSLKTLRLVEVEQAEGDDYQHKLVPFSSAPCLAASLSHAVIPLGTSEATQADKTPGLTILTTRDGKVTGMTASSPTNECSRARSQLLFEAQLAFSLTCVRQGNTTPPWSRASTSGVMVDNIVGIATDGTLVGISVLDEKLWRRLFWLQRICEWSAVLSPHAVERITYAVDDQELDSRERGFPIGLSEESEDDIALFTADNYASIERDMHIDGDVLTRLLAAGGAEALRDAISVMAERDDRVGEWVAEHLDEELRAADEIIGDLRVLLGPSI